MPTLFAEQLSFFLFCLLSIYIYMYIYTWLIPICTYMQELYKPTTVCTCKHKHNCTRRYVDMPLGLYFCRSTLYFALRCFALLLGIIITATLLCGAKGLWVRKVDRCCCCCYCCCYKKLSAPLICIAGE